MRFVLNFNVSPAVGGALANLGHDSQRAAPGQPDESILASAVEQGAVVVTCDLDFAALVYEKRLPHAGIVLFRLRRNTAENQINVLTTAIAAGRVSAGTIIVLADADLG